jgi:heme-degrading monooxygenase HmoA
MYTRVVECNVKLTRKDDFFNTLQNQVLPLAKKQPGFVDLMGWASDEHPDHLFAVTFWKSKEDAERFYRQEAPMVELLSPLSENVATEHYYVLISTAHRLSTGQAASA